MAKKQRSRNLIIAAVIVGLFFLVQSGTINFRPFVIGLDSNLGECDGGFTAFSIDRVTITQGDNIEDRIRVFGRVGGAECLSIDLTPNALNAFLESQGFESTRTITGSAILKKWIRTFPIDRAGRSYKSIADNRVLSGTRLVFTNPTTYCRNNGFPDTIKGYKPSPAHNIRCVLPGANGLIGSFESARGLDDFDIEFKIGSRTGHITRQDRFINLGPHRIEWEGNLLNFDNLFAPQFDGRLIGSKWQLVRDGAESQIENKIDTFTSCLGSPPVFDSEYDSCRNSFAVSSSSILSNELDRYRNDIRAIAYDADTDSGALGVSLRRTPFPVFILDLEASDVGIIRLQGDPEITQCLSNNLELSSGDSEVFNFRVRNNGQSSEFFASVECDRGVTGFGNNFQISKNVEKTETIELIPSNSDESDLQFSCDLTVTDSGSGQESTCGFGGVVEFESGIICAPDRLTCDDALRNVLKCNAEGTNKVLEKSCDLGCIYDNGEARCRVDDDDAAGGGGNFFSNLWNKIKDYFADLFEGFGTALQILKGITVVVGAIVSGFISKGLFSRIKGLRKNKLALNSLSIFVGLSFGAFLFIFIGSFVFWILIIGLIVAMVTLNLIPKPARNIIKRGIGR